MPLWVQRASNIFLISRHFHAHSSSKSYGLESIWFTKVVCLLCFHHSQQSLGVFSSDYFRRNLDPYIAFNVIQHINTNLNNPRLAFRFFEYSRINLNLVHSIGTFNLLLRSLCQMGFHDLAVLVFKYMKTDGYLVESSILDSVVLALANAGKFGFAKEILISQGELGSIVRPFVHNSLLSLLMKRSRVDEAVDFFKDHILRPKTLFPDTCTFNIVIRGLCRVGGVDKAFEFFNDMQSFGCFPDIVTYNTLISGLCTVGQVDRARRLLTDLELQDGLSPDVVTYTSVISGYCKLSRMDEAINLMDEMITYGISPNVVTFNILINGFGKIGDMFSATNIYGRMCAVGYPPDVVTFTSLIDGYCRTGELDQGLKLWDEMNIRNMSPNLYTFSVLIGALSKENRLNEARELLRQLKLRDDIIPQPFVYNPVLDGFCKAGNLNEANVIAAEMESKGCCHDKITFTILILGHCMKGRMLEAMAIFDKMLSLGCVPDDITVSCLTSCLLKAGMAKEAYKVRLTSSKDLNTDLSSSKPSVPFRTSLDIPVAV
ncbi:pentatricopeptide repeat-containing protein At2g06000 [Lycium barbarum]|uniref:pentatricopeptide repeat-containing protein At2g06000 n=1 Tax=Lycium barbarum TaxID=112863 RepID=UPI00293E31D1|nr:pentatricopeptide repeat-containing protein At2g06000 [Lycium barbarum]XP_060167790.1 pentatricopeptide repeat-containing protein At2g06000 [Lycium barbarum]XP_060167792.1 pentatricopeptide repeat-containing protein At2g06000 [Lycium barbarum]XP_060167793.1 pentatricopeptide repeat-containing protein At2g06000 [Lycium barbarum]XP_060167794.1 pentatricopeptide repeat-containing protein At2g06000 [Lycium barbarum]XP_060167795.1 pentatricopeptide repeat-containing protein At2g06000 [Lycium bar